MLDLFCCIVLVISWISKNKLMSSLDHLDLNPKHENLAQNLYSTSKILYPSRKFSLLFILEFNQDSLARMITVLNSLITIAVLAVIMNVFFSFQQSVNYRKYSLHKPVLRNALFHLAVVDLN